MFLGDKTKLEENVKNCFFLLLLLIIILLPLLLLLAH